MAEESESGNALSHFVKGLVKLDWVAPARWLPHGLLGAVSLILGAVMIAELLLGVFNWVQSPIVVATYTLSTMGNAIAGYRISNRAGKVNGEVFRHAALLQVSLVYYAWRFSSTDPTTSPIVRALDVAASLVLVSQVFWVAQRALSLGLVGIPLLSGAFALLLLAGYPAQLAYGGDEWWMCVLQRYPQQSLGFSGYVYTSASWTFGALSFGATLSTRQIVPEKAFLFSFITLVMATLIATVMCQEIWIPVVSTQKLLIPCPDSGEGDWLHDLAEVLDTSALAQAVLDWWNGN